MVLGETPKSLVMGIQECLGDIEDVEVKLNVENLQCYTGLDLKDIDFHPAWSVPDDSDIVRKCQTALGEMAMEVKPIAIHYCSNGSQSA